MYVIFYGNAVQNLCYPLGNLYDTIHTQIYVCVSQFISGVFYRGIEL